MLLWHSQTFSHTMADDDDDSVLDLADQHNRPIDDAFNQQRIQAWHPILDPWWVIIALFYLGLIMVPAGTFLFQPARLVVACFANGLKLRICHPALPQ